MLEKIKKYWNDPVFSKVIAAGIIAISSYILYQIREIILRIPFKEGVESTHEYINSESSINNKIILIASLLLFISIIFSSIKLFTYLVSFLNKKRKNDDKELPGFQDGNSATFFAHRMGKAFPDVRGFKWITDPQIATERLIKLLEDPLKFNDNSIKNSWVTPIWWFREFSANDITSFKIMNSPLWKKKSKNQVLMNIEEMNINKIGVYKSKSYYHHFIYVETSPSKPTGLYRFTKEDHNNSIKSFGYIWEEYALLNKTPIKSEEYKNGAALIKGKLVDAKDAKLRVRYLSKYNFIIAANESAFNVSEFENKNKDFFKLILKGEIEIEELIKEVDACKKSKIIRYH